MNRDNIPIICPVCIQINSKDDWNKTTLKVWPTAVSIKLTVERRDLYADNEYICPYCKEASRLRHLVHKH